MTPCSSPGLNYNTIGSQVLVQNSISVSIIRRVHLLFIGNICSILLPSFHLHFLWPSCRVCDTFHYHLAPGPHHPLADIFHLLRNFYQSSPLLRVNSAPVQMQIPSPCAASRAEFAWSPNWIGAVNDVTTAEGGEISPGCPAREYWWLFSLSAVMTWPGQCVSLTSPLRRR